jgi:hypothetical protein
MEKIKPLPLEIQKMVKKFPTNNSLLLPDGYFSHVVHYLSGTEGKFLEIGYRKGIFVEVCKILSVESVHIDMTDKLLRAIPSDKNICLTMNSLAYLSSTQETFSLIFQDGSKSHSQRLKECETIMKREILCPGGYLIVDDLHYPACKKSFEKAHKLFGYVNPVVIKTRGKPMGIMQR